MRTARWGLVGFAAVVALVLAGCGGGSNSSPSPGTSTTSSGTTAAQAPAAAGSTTTGSSPGSLVPEAFQQNGIVLAVDASFPPLGFRDESGNLTGLYVDMGRALEEKLGVKMTIKGAAFDSLIPGIQAGRYDMTSFNDTPEREQVLDFVDYFADGTLIIVPKGNPSNLSIHSLCGMRVAVERGSEQQTSVAPMLAKACKSAGKDSIDVQVFTGSDEAALALRSGRIDAILAEQVNAEWVARKSDGAFEVPTETAVDRHLVGYAFPKNSGLAPALVAAFKALKEDGTYQDLLAKWSLESTAINTFPINAAAG